MLFCIRFDLCALHLCLLRQRLIRQLQDFEETLEASSSARKKKLNTVRLGRPLSSAIVQPVRKTPLYGKRWRTNSVPDEGGREKSSARCTRRRGAVHNSWHFERIFVPLNTCCLQCAPCQSTTLTKGIVEARRRSPSARSDVSNVCSFTISFAGSATSPHLAKPGVSVGMSWVY